jgi:hypothetical protein
MATRARFGRLPRSSPSLTSTIVALAQQYQNQRDNNIETAWKSGGLFEGKKVTDEAFLKHWKDRLASVDPQDPMWDYYNNLIYGYEFNVADAKIGQKYAEGTVSDAQMASFYRKWASKMPVNSANYRQLMTQAAKYKAAATARGYGRSSKAAAEAYNRRQQATYNEKEAPYDVATSLIARYAVDAGYLDSSDLNDPDYGWSKLTNASGENDPSNFADLLSDIMGNEQVREGMTRFIRKYDPNFSGTFTDESLAQMANNARNGAGIRGTRARKAGDKTGANAADKAMDNYAKSSMVIRASLGSNAEKGFVEQNEYYRGQMDAVLSPNSGASPIERASAMQRYGQWLGGDGLDTLAKSFPAGSFDPLSDNYNPYASGLMGRTKNTMGALAGKPTGQTLKDDTFGFSSAEAGAESDAVRLGTQSAELQTSLGNVASGKSMVVKTDMNGNINPRGDSWSVFDRNSPEVQNLELVPMASSSVGSIQFSDGTVIGGANGEVRYVQAEPVKARVYGSVDPRTGAGVQELKPNPAEEDVIGSRVEMQGPGGTPYVLWGVWVNGTKVWTTVNPFSEVGKGSEGRDDKGNYVISYKAPEGTIKPGTTPAPYSPSQYVNPGAVKRNVGGIDSTDGTKWDPNTDKETGYNSPMAALANSSSAAAKYVADMGDKAIANAEREWYSSQTNWTPEMKVAIGNGADPAVVVETQSKQLLNKVQSDRYWGYTPEDQQRTRSALKLRGESQAAAREGITIEAWRVKQGRAADDNERADIAAQLNKWGQKSLMMPGYQYGPGGITATSTKIGPSKVEEWQKKGWSVAELLNQPGMSTQQANDLAYRISNGAVGSAMPGMQVEAGTTGQVRARGVSRMRVNQPNQYVNPYLSTDNKVPQRVAPKPVSAPARPMYGPPAPVKPMYGPPAPVRTMYGPPAPKSAQGGTLVGGNVRKVL